MSSRANGHLAQSGQALCLILVPCRPVLPVSWSSRRRLNRHLSNPHWPAWRGRPINTSMKSTKKPRPPVPSSINVSDLGGDSGSRLHAGGAKNPWGKKNNQKKGEKKKKHQQKEILKIATYNVRTLSKDEHVQELKEELKETNIKWDVIGLGEIRRKEEGFTTLQSGHLLCHSKANNGQAGVGFLINKKWKDNITRVNNNSPRVAELVLRIRTRLFKYMLQRHHTQKMK